MRSIIFAFSLLFFTTNLSCNKSSPESEELPNEAIQSYKISSKDIDDLQYTEYVLSDVSLKHTEGWMKFQELHQQIEILKSADLSFFEDDKELLQGFMTELKTEIPEKLNETSIIARLVALETTIYKLHDEAVFNTDSKETLLNAVKEVLVSYSNLLFQINKMFEKDAQNIEKPTN